MISASDLTASVVFLAGATFCSWNGIRGMRGGPLWIDPIENVDGLEPQAVYGKPALALGIVYLATAAGCLAVVVQIFV